MNPIDCDAILFDLDGVLIDSYACITRHWQEWARRNGLEWTAIMRVAHGRRTEETIQLVAPHLDVAEEARLIEASEAGDTRGVYPVEGASGLLASLPGETWAIATSGTRAVATSRLKHTGLPIPRVLITADEVSRGKPDPEPYLAAAQGLGVPAERCMVIEDAPAGIEAARAAGMLAVAIASTHSADELGRASLIARQLGDIRVEQGSVCRLAIRVEGGI
jgi:sugar-phosphatase